VNPKISSIAFEQRYADDSGVEFAVKYHNYAEPCIEFQHINSITFPLEKLDWIINCLLKIRSETNESKS